MSGLTVKAKNDAVFYDCDNPDFEEYITDKEFRHSIGSFSDISLIALVNLSSGYYNVHTFYEFINVAEFHDTIRRIGEIVYVGCRPVAFRVLRGDSFCFLNRRKIVRYDAKNMLATFVPFVFYDICVVLLDFYFPAKLKSFCEEFGDHVLWQCYE